MNRIIFFTIFQTLFNTSQFVRGIDLSSVKFISRGEIPADNKGQVGVETDQKTGFDSSNFHFIGAMAGTITGWIDIGSSLPSSLENKIQLYQGWYPYNKFFIFGNDNATFHFEEQYQGIHGCNLAYAANNRYRFILSFQTSNNADLIMVLQDGSGTIRSCSLNTGKSIFIFGPNIFVFQLQNPDNAALPSSSTMGAISFIQNYFLNLTDSDIQRFLLGFGGDAHQVFYFKFSHERAYCDCLIDSTSNHIQAKSTLSYSVAKSQAGGGYFNYAFTQNEVLSFKGQNIKFGPIMDSLNIHLSSSQPVDYRLYQGVSFSFWIKVSAGVASFQIFKYSTQTTNFTLQISFNSNNNLYMISLQDSGNSKTLYSSISPDTLTHLIISINYQFVNIYVNGVFSNSYTGLFPTFFLTESEGSIISIGGSNVPSSSIVNLSQFRSYSTNAVLASSTAASTVIINCKALIQEKSQYSCLLCQSGYFLKSTGQCVLTCSVSETALSNVRMCAPGCPYGCLSCSSSERSECTACSGNRTIKNNRCICPAGTYEDYRSENCIGVNLLTQDYEFGQFFINQVSTKTINFKDTFSCNPKIVLSILGHSNQGSTGVSASIPYFFLSTSLITPSSFVVSTNSANPLYIHVQYFAFSSNSTLFDMGTRSLSMNSTKISDGKLLDLGIYAPANNHTVQFFLGGFSCNYVNNKTNNRCFFQYQSDNSYIFSSSSTANSFQVQNLFIYYLISPVYISTSYYTISPSMSTYTKFPATTDYIKAKYSQDTFSYTFSDSDIVTNVMELSSFNMMYSIVGLDFQKDNFQYFKFSPSLSEAISSAALSLTVESIMRTATFNKIIFQVTPFFLKYSSKLCIYYDSYSLKCQACFNQQDPNGGCLCLNTYIDIGTSCVCPTGTWEDTVNKVCVTCHKSCVTCSSAIFCTNCLGSLAHAFSNLCDCATISEWYDSTGTCHRCDISCITCSNGASCDTCVSGLSKTSNFCVCPDGTWFNTTTLTCDPCYLTCQTCNNQKIGTTENCLSCNGERDLYLQSCVCQYSNDKRIYPEELHCSEGQNAVLDAILSQDFLTLTIDFGIYIAPLNTLPSNSTSLCVELFQSSTQALIGADSICKFSSTSQIIVKLGSLARILVEETLNLKVNTIMFSYNGLFITKYFRTTVSQLSPTVTSNFDICYQLIQNYCYPQQVSISSLSNDGGRGYSLLTWSLISITPTDANVQATLDTEIIQANTDQKQTLKIDPHLSVNSLVIVIQLNIKFYTNQNKANQIFIQVQAQKMIKNGFALSQSGPYYRYNEIIMSINFFALSCHADGSIFVTDDLMDVEITNPVLGVNDSFLNQSINKVSKTIPAFSTNVNTIYSFDVKSSISTDPKSSNLFQIQFEYSLTSLFVKIIGGNQYISYLSNSTIEGSFKDFELDNSTNPPPLNGIFKNWSCLNIVTLQNCIDSLGNEIILPNDEALSFPSNTFNPYNVVRFILTGTKTYTDSSNTISRTKSDSVIIFFTDMDIPPLSLSLDDRVKSRLTINLNQIVHAQLIYSASSTPQNIYYTGAIIYNYDVVATMKFEYDKIRFQLWDFYDKFDPNNLSFQIRFSAYNPEYVMPSLTTLEFLLNFPPSQCSLSLTPLTLPAYGVSTLFKIQMSNCQDTDSPLQYQFFYYLTAYEYLLEKQDPLLVKRKWLSDIQSSDTLTTSLPSGTIIVLVRAIDSKEAISNCTKQIPLIAQPLTSANYLPYIQSQLSQIQYLLPEQQIAQLNLISQDLLDRGFLLSPIDLNTQQQLVISMIEQATLIILPTSSLHQMASQTIAKIYQSSMIIPPVQITTKLTGLQQDLTNVMSKCTTSQVSQEKYENCLYNSFFIFNQIDGLGTNSDDTILSNNQQFINLSETLGSLLTQYALPNENPIKYQGNNIKIISQKITSKFLSNYLGINQERRFLADSSDDATIYDVSIKTYKKNYYSQDESQISYQAQLANQTNYSQIATVFPTINPSIINTTNSSSIQPNRGIAHFFTNQEPKKNLTCFSKSSSKWTTKGCQTNLIVKTGEIQCLCPSISPTSVVEDISSLFTSNENIDTAFGTQGLSNLSNWTEFYNYIVFWVMLVQLIGFIILLIKAKRLDEKSRIEVIKILSLKRSFGMNRNKNQVKIELFQYESLHDIKVGKVIISQQGEEFSIQKSKNNPDQLDSLSSKNLESQNRITMRSKKQNEKIQKGIILIQSSKSLERKMNVENYSTQFNFNNGTSSGIKTQMTILDENGIKNTLEQQQSPFKFLPQQDILQIGSEENPTTRELKIENVKDTKTLRDDDENNGFKSFEEFDLDAHENESKQVPEPVKKAKELTSEEKKKLGNLNKFWFFIYFHEFFSIFVIYYKNLSRQLRFILFYLRYTHSLVISILFSSVIKSLVQAIFISFISSIIFTIFSKLISSLLMKYGIKKKIGVLITFSIIGFYLYLILSVQSGKEPSISNQFIWSYVQVLITDMALYQTLTAIVFSQIAKQVIRSQEEQNCFFKIFDFLRLNLIVTSLINILK